MGFGRGQRWHWACEGVSQRSKGDDDGGPGLDARVGGARPDWPLVRALAPGGSLHSPSPGGDRREALVAPRLAHRGSAHRARAGKPDSRPRSCAAACTSSTSRGSTASTRCRSSSCRKARSPTCTRGTAVRCPRPRPWDGPSPATTSRKRPPSSPAEASAGRQRAFLREGVFALNLALFVVITEEGVFGGPVRDSDGRKYADWRQQLAGRWAASTRWSSATPAGRRATQCRSTRISRTGRSAPHDTIGVVTVQDGPPIESSEVIAPEVKPKADEHDHHYFQDPEAFLELGGRRGKQLQVLTDGTFFMNRWFATVEILPKTVIPIGYVGVVVGYYGGRGKDVTGEAFRYGEQVEAGERGVWKRALPPGKYALNPYALRVELVPTVNFVLRWITGQVEAHQYDKDLHVARPHHGRRLRADAPALPRAAHRLREGPARHPALRRREAAHQPDAGPDPLRLLPRRRPELEHARPPDPARGDPAAGRRRSWVGASGSTTSTASPSSSGGRSRRRKDPERGGSDRDGCSTSSGSGGWRRSRSRPSPSRRRRRSSSRS